MFSKQFITIPYSKDFFRVHSENRKLSLILSDAVAKFNKSGAWNKRGGAKFGPFLISVVVEITELWVENSQKINCRDVTSIREGRVIELFFYMTKKSRQKLKYLKNGKSF